MTEKRAQEAEERASAAELELASAMEMVRSLQKQIEKMTNASDLPSVSVTTVPSTVVATPPAASPSLLKESPRQSSTDSTKADGKKKEPRSKSSNNPKKKDRS